MTSISSALRRTLFFVVLAVGVGVLLSWQRGRAATPTPGESPQWPAWSSDPDVAAQPSSDRTVDQLSWVPPNADGAVPRGHPVKAKESSGIFHVPGGRFYDRTNADRCYRTAAAAEADGYRQSKT